MELILQICWLHAAAPLFRPICRAYNRATDGRTDGKRTWHGGSCSFGKGSYLLAFLIEPFSGAGCRVLAAAPERACYNHTMCVC
jgi:hypothetical protein